MWCLKRSALSVLVSGALAIGCEVTEPASDRYTGYSLDISNIRFYLETGDSVRFRAVRRDPLTGDTAPAQVSWRSSAPAVVSITMAGMAVAHAQGTALIEAESGGGGVGWHLTVIPRIAGLRLTPDTLRLLPADLALLRFTALDSAGSPIREGDLQLYQELQATVTWSTDDAAVALAGVVVTARAPGRTWIHAGLGRATDSVSVAVILMSFSDVQASADRSCGRTTENELYCWPYYGAYTSWDAPAHLPRRPDDTLRLSLMTLGSAHGCGLAVDGSAYCFGSNEFGQLGTGSTAQPSASGLVPVAGEWRFGTLAAGTYHTCGITVQHEVVCWGLTEFGQAGDTTDTECGFGGKIPVLYPCAPTPQIVRVPDSVGATPVLVSLAAGSTHTCGLAADGAAFCWGWLARPLGRWPVPQAAGYTFLSIESAGQLACGLTDGGPAYCWGSDGDGLGDGLTDSSDAPIVVPAPVPFKALAGSKNLSLPSSPGDAGMCAVASGGDAYCWSTTRYPTPTKVAAGVPFESLGPGHDHACGLGTDGRAYCWSDHGYRPALGFAQSMFVLGVPERVDGQP